MNAHAIISRRGLVGAAAIAGSALVAGCDVPAIGTGSETRPIISDSAGHGDDAAPEKEPEPTPAERALASMTREEKVAQLFMVTPEQLTGASVATIAGAMTEEALGRYPVGGLIYFSQNLVDAQQVRDLVQGSKRLGEAAGAGIAPFIGVDEEGGPLVARIANSGLFDVPHFPNMADIGATGDPAQAAEVGRTIGGYLAEIGFSLDFAPDADVLTNPANPVIGARSFGSDPALVASMVSAEVEAMLETGVMPCVKHFPGHGDTAGDSHTGAVYTVRTREEIEAAEFQPFRAAIEAGCPFVMVGHIETPNVAADGLPASLSPTMMTDVLRGELGFEGVIISDSFAMGAIVDNYGVADAAVRFFQAGGDMLLMPQNLAEAHAGVLDAINQGAISEERLDESVLRILSAKERAGLIA